MRRADRLFQIVQLLRNRRFATADELATELEVSKRTIYRDIRDIQLSGIPIHGEAGVGYQLQRGFELPPLTFNSEEVEALVLGARVVETWGDPDLAAASRSLMTKVEAVLPETLRDVLMRTALFAPRSRRSRAATAGALGLIRRAVAERRKVRLHYTRADGDQNERTIRPLGLHFWGSSWSVAAWCEMRTDYRNFRPDRMHDVRLTDDTFDETEGITLGAYLEHMERRAEEQGFTDMITGAGPRRPRRPEK